MFTHDHRCVRAIISLANAMKESTIYVYVAAAVRSHQQRQPTVRTRCSSLPSHGVSRPTDGVLLAEPIHCIPTASSSSHPSANNNNNIIIISLSQQHSQRRGLNHTATLQHTVHSFTHDADDARLTSFIGSTLLDRGDKKINNIIVRHQHRSRSRQSCRVVDALWMRYRSVIIVPYTLTHH